MFLFIVETCLTVVLAVVFLAITRPHRRDHICPDVKALIRNFQNFISFFSVNLAWRKATVDRYVVCL